LGIKRPALFSARDQFGIALARVMSSGALNSQTVEWGHSETVFVLTYYYEFESGIVLQPDFQWIVQLGLFPSLDDALVFTIRFNYAL